MLNAILGIKIEQSFIFDDKGQRLPVTKVDAGSCYLVGRKTTEIDGYNAFILGFGKKKPNRVRKTQKGFFEKAGFKEFYPRYLKEIRVESFSEETKDLKTGNLIDPSQVFQGGEKVNVIGKSKGKGFAGVVKRHHFKGGPRTHGQSDRERAPGAIGQTTTPGRVYKGKRMAGRMGGDRITVKNLNVVKVDAETKTVFLKGLVPGPSKSLLIIRKN